MRLMHVSRYIETCARVYLDTRIYLGEGERVEFASECLSYRGRLDIRSSAVEGPRRRFSAGQLKAAVPAAHRTRRLEQGPVCTVPTGSMEAVHDLQSHLHGLVWKPLRCFLHCAGTTAATSLLRTSARGSWHSRDTTRSLRDVARIALEKNKT